MTQEPPTLELLEGPSPEALLPNHGLWPWWLAAAVLILAGVALAVVIRRRRRQPFDAAALRETARRKALAALDDVRGEDPRETAVRTSLILREYLSVAAADPVLFETHEEFLARHDSLAALTPEARDAAQVGFDRLAALKYGPHQPAAEAASIVADCRGLLDTLHKGFTA